MTSDVVVIIPALNAAEVLPRQLQALAAQTDQNFRLIVSDNGSTDDTRAVCLSWAPRFRGLEVLDASDRRGAAHARNAAIASSREPLILTCDADDEVGPSWVSAMRSALSWADAATGPLQVRYPDLPRLDTTWNADALPVSMGFRTYIPSGNMGARRGLFDSVGPFDEDLWRGQEDVDFGWRCVASGATLAHVPEARLTYYQRSDLRALLRQQFRYGRAHVELYLKHQDDPGAPSPASYRASVRWFWHWARQFPASVRRGGGRLAVGGATFQIGRLLQCVLSRTRSPL